MPKGQSRWYDVTLHGEYTEEQIRNYCNAYCKKWAFQKESGAKTGYEHYQAKFFYGQPVGLEAVITSLAECGLVKCHVERSYDLSFAYVTKDDTRIAGPWRYDDPVIPKWLHESPTWRAWQKEVINEAVNNRQVTVIIDEIGNTGKSYMSNWFAVRKQATILQLVGTYKDLLRAVYDRPKTGWYIVDVPRAEKLRAPVLAAIEDIKNGHVFDDRYEFRETWFDPPKVTVFTNKQPDAKQLSYDRWNVRKIVKRNDQWELAPL